MSCVCVLQTCSVFLDVCSALFLFSPPTYVCVCHSFHFHCGSAFEPGASGLPYYCTTICVHSCCTFSASCVDPKPTKKGKKQDNKPVSSSRALPDYPITEPTVCVPDVVGTLAAWWQNTQEKKPKTIRSGVRGSPSYRAPLVCVPAVIGLLAVRRHTASTPKKNQCMIKI